MPKSHLSSTIIHLRVERTELFMERLQILIFTLICRCFDSHLAIFICRSVQQLFLPHVWLRFHMLVCLSACLSVSAKKPTNKGKNLTKC
ncbi:hypothetical protein Y032_0919g3041 [Ancylostoma ceylanicum]|uniref:Uncharacterized protein n=1 Tax=Ancylostoma ceylanicum TaxID=53326 RepID=A0A016WAC0_9BILA|nr:hypothetical protein Y032_0919g3041 [Ancylostoma ceylanicum]